jgi:16S rRNA U516 pseudouridylate synthase RsuA-like enzyme
VLELKRIKIGGLRLDLESGQWRFLTAREDQALTDPRTIDPRDEQ